MNVMRFRLLAACLALTTACGFASEGRVSPVLRSMLGGGPLPTEKVFYDSVDDNYIYQLSADDVREFLPLARRLLSDPRPEARKYALLCFLAVTPRPGNDSQVLLEPYVQDLLRIAADRRSPLQNMALFVLSNTRPKVSPTTLAYASAHLADKDNTPDQTDGMVWILLMAYSDPLTRDVIAFARKRNDNGVTESVFKALHVLPRKNPEVLSFIDNNLENQDAWVRRGAIEAVMDLPWSERSPFFPKLDRLSTDSNETAEIRALAAEALKK